MFTEGKEKIEIIIIIILIFIVIAMDIFIDSLLLVVEINFTIVIKRILVHIRTPYFAKKIIISYET